MSLKTKIYEDLNSAMKAKDNVRTETLRSIRAEILKMDQSGMNREMNEEEEIELISRQAKMRKESIEMFGQAGRQDLV
ncbi:MAG: GatB/YqeY domain-containing protein, partial [Ignavibacteria bacterium]